MKDYQSKRIIDIVKLSPLNGLDWLWNFPGVTKEQKDKNFKECINHYVEHILEKKNASLIYQLLADLEYQFDEYFF